MTWENGDDYDDGGKRLFDSLSAPTDDGSTRALIVEACRAKDRLDRLHRIVRGDEDTWTRVFTGEGELVLKLDTAVSEVRQLSTVFRQLLTEIQRRQGNGGGADEEDGLAGL